jgi:hypothetical protein
MDQAEGFFPERRLLAYRRSLASAQLGPAPTVRQGSSAWSTWWILLICMGPSYLSIWVSMSPRLIADGRPLQLLIFGSYCLIACVLIVSVLGMFLGIYRGLNQAPRNIL